MKTPCYKKYQGKKGFLVQEPSVIDAIVRRFKKLDEIVKKKFGKTEYDAWERGKDKIKETGWLIDGPCRL